MVYKDPKDRDVMIQRLNQEGKLDNYEIEMLTRKGNTINVVTNIHLDGDKITGVVLDITERKQMEEKMLKYIDELERFQAATVQREFRMKDLRDENDRLKKEIEDLKLKSR